MKALKPLIIICVAALFATSCKKDVDMTLVEKTLFENTIISQIEVSDAWNVNVVADSVTYVKVEYSAYLADKLSVTMEGNKLHIGFNGKVYTQIGSVFQATVHTNRLEQLDVDEAAKVNCSGAFVGQQVRVDLDDAAMCNGLIFSGETCEIDMDNASVMTGFVFTGTACNAELDNASQFNGQICASNQMDIDLDNASRFVNKVVGETAEVSIKSQNVSILNMVETTIGEMHVELLTGSEATVQVSSLLEGQLKDGSTLYYKGTPQLQVDCDESSSIHPL